MTPPRTVAMWDYRVTNKISYRPTSEDHDESITGQQIEEIHIFVEIRHLPPIAAPGPKKLTGEENIAA
ncbi:hypothetical protein PENSTE_c025G01612 [Penicillium steckii]|uniref:Uncharacterized protein n=1 Tax=Penicillium steckii TaxID=303698 RepID=A0A1V6SQ28_9EURO|nr:hypothetical protein PENSTE_c025G01612 [Penicillium steckii]